jgi:regulatory protein
VKKRAEREPPSARDRALGLLSRREHSTRELKQKLAQRGYEAADRDDAIESLARSDYQSDDRFAEVLIRQRAAAGYGPRYIESELRSHGIAPAAHRELFDAQDWSTAAKRLVARRYDLRDRSAQLKAAQFLARRGFSSDLVRKLTKAEIDDV